MGRHGPSGRVHALLAACLLPLFACGGNSVSAPDNPTASGTTAAAPTNGPFTLRASPIFSRSQQSRPNALALVSAADRDLRNVAVRQVSVHRVRRLLEPRVSESNNLAVKIRDKRDRLRMRFWRMLPAVPVACCYCLN